MMKEQKNVNTYDEDCVPQIVYMLAIGFLSIIVVLSVVKGFIAIHNRVQEIQAQIHSEIQQNEPTKDIQQETDEIVSVESIDRAIKDNKNVNIYISHVDVMTDVENVENIENVETFNVGFPMKDAGDDDGYTYDLGLD